MRSFIISYDLNNSDKNYNDLIARIESYPKAAKINKSVWFIKAAKTSPQVRDDLLTVMDSDDSLFVAKLSGEAAWHNAICGSKHLKENL